MADDEEEGFDISKAIEAARKQRLEMAETPAMIEAMEALKGSSSAADELYNQTRPRTEGDGPPVDNDEIDEEDFEIDPEILMQLTKGTDLRDYATEIESELRKVEKDSIADFLGEAESLAGLHKEIGDVDGVLDTMEGMLRGFQGDLNSISSQIKYLQDESLSMNVKLRNRKAVETQLSSFLEQIVIPPDLITAICDAEVNESYLGHVLELNKKCVFAKSEFASQTKSAEDVAPELEKLRIKAISKIRDFLLTRIATLKKKMTNIQILQTSVLLKYTGLYGFLMEHAPEVAAEVREVYVTTMSAIYLRQVKTYLNELVALKTEPASKSDLLGTDEWSAASTLSVSSFFSRAAPTARSDKAYRVAERVAALQALDSTPLLAVVASQSGEPVHYECIFASVSYQLLESVGSELSFMKKFFGESENFDQLFGKAIFHCMESLP